MQTKKQLVKVQDFVNAVNAANNVLQTHPKSKLAHWCSRFIELNKEPLKEVKKRDKKATFLIKREFDDFQVSNCVEKDGVVLTDEKGELKFSKEATKVVAAEREIVNEKLEEITEKLMAEDIEVRVFLTEYDLPEINITIKSHLKAFVFPNSSEWDEEIEELN